MSTGWGKITYTKDLKGRYQSALDKKQLPPEIDQILRSNGILKNGTIDENLLRRYLVRNVFFHISGVRNRTLLKAKGESIIMSMDDDAPPETYVVKEEERERVRQERLQARERWMKVLMREAGELLGESIDTEEELYKLLANVKGSMKGKVDSLMERYFGYDPMSRAGRIPLAMGEIKVREEQMLDQDGWGKKLGISHQRYHGLMTPLPSYMLTVSDFVYPRPRTEKKQGQFDVLPVNVHRMGDLIGKKAGETNLPLMGSPLDRRGDLRGTMAQPVEVAKREALADKTVSYVAAPFVEDQDTSGIAQFIRYLEIERKKAANLQHANQSALLVEGIGGFIADTYVIFNRSALSNDIVSPSIGRDLRLEEPPYIVWVKSPMLENKLTVAYSPVAGGQQREIAERMYDINHQDYTEVVGVIARATYERAVRRFYKALESRPDLQGEGKHYQRLRFLGQLYMEEAQLFEITEEQRMFLDVQRKARAMMLGELSKQKAQLIQRLSNEPGNTQLAQEIRDIDLIFVQYAESFTFYHSKDQRNFDYSPKTDQSDYFYKVLVKDGKLNWERVQPYLEVDNERGLKVAKKTEWLKHSTKISGQSDMENFKPGEAIEIETGRTIILSQTPQEGDEFIVPVLFTQMEAEFTDNVRKKAADQIRSDGELLIVWPDLVDVAIPWQKDAEVHAKVGNDENIIQRIHELSDQTVELKTADAQAKTPFRYSFYQQPNRRLHKGSFSLQLNPDRKGKRPSQYSGNGIKQEFDANKFNYNKIPSEEVISEDQINGMNVTTVVNVSPFAEGHFLLVPERAAGHPQYLDKSDYLLMALERMAASSKSNLKITYNSLGAFASINHLHFQGFYYGGDLREQEPWNDGQLPVERMERQEIATVDGVKISQVQDYPAHALAFASNDNVKLAQTVFKYVNILNERSIAYNILITKKEVIVLPRKFEFANSLGAGTAVLEMAGEFIAFDQETVEQVTEESIKRELKDTAIEQDLFDQTVTKLTDQAMRSNTGGIDLNAKNMGLDITKDSKRVEIKFDAAMVAEFQRGDFSGVVPVILRITPVQSLLPILGLGTGLEATELARK